MSEPEKQPSDWETLKSRFTDAQEPQLKAWTDQQSQVPDRLYHYTTLDAMTKIIDSTVLRASDVRYMNDSSELTHAAKLIDEVFYAVVDESEQQDLLKDFARPESQPFGSFASGRNPYIACFCEDGDLLSQWRGYGDTNASVSIGMDLRNVAHDLPPNTFLRKVVYKEKRQRALVREATNTWIGTIRTLLDEGCEPADLMPPARWALRRAMEEFLLCFKHPTFKEEQEWRLIKVVHTDQEVQMMAILKRAKAEKTAGVNPIQFPPLRGAQYVGAEGIEICFRPTAYGFTPYIVVPIHDPILTGPVPIESITQGPRRHRELALDSLSNYIRSQFFGGRLIRVKATSVPLRV